MNRWLDPQPVNTSSLDDLNLHPLVAQTRSMGICSHMRPNVKALHHALWTVTSCCACTL